MAKEPAYITAFKEFTKDFGSVDIAAMQAIITLTQETLYAHIRDSSSRSAGNERLTGGGI